jgi:CHAT domain-containing protein
LAEGYIIHELFQHHTDLIGQDATRTNVLQHLPTHPWIHFACHGFQDDKDPFESAFMLTNEPLTLRDFITAHPGLGGLAFLSACGTAASAPHIGAPDEVSASVQFCGFASIIGTTWQMMDNVGPPIADEFYRAMFNKGGGTVNLRDSAEALHKALTNLKNSGKPPEDWACFIHIGI